MQPTPVQSETAVLLVIYCALGTTNAVYARSQCTLPFARVVNMSTKYDAVATKLRYAASGLLLAYRKVERNKVAKKQGKHPRQAALLPFLKKPPN